MNRIVKRHYPAAKLPEDLRKGLPVGSHVTVTVDEEAAGAPMTREELLKLADTASEKDGGVTPDQAVKRTKAIRDEWDS